MFCLTCDADKHPVQTFTSKGLVDACPTCQGVFARHDDAATTAVAPAPIAPVVAPPPRPAAGDALSLLDQVRARLAFCEEQIAARDAFISERDMLRKMLAAAETSTAPMASIFTN